MVTESLILAGSLWTLPWTIFNRETAIYGIKVGAAGLIMAGMTWPFRQLFVIYPISLGIVTYILLIRAFGTLNAEELAMGYDFVQRSRRQLLKPVQRLLLKNA
ncbi:MAG: hypothetical protein R3A44_03170 [Caldilineaceae bacterium]